MTVTVNPVLVFAVLLTSILIPVFVLPTPGIGEGEPAPSTNTKPPYWISPVVDMELLIFKPDPFPIIPLTEASIPVFIIWPLLTEAMIPVVLSPSLTYADIPVFPLASPVTEIAEPNLTVP